MFDINLIWHWPQYTYTFFLLLGEGLILGKEAGKSYDKIVSIVSAILVVVVLYYGGFWSGASP